MNNKPDINEFTDGSAFTLFFASEERVRILDVVLSRKSLDGSIERLSTLANVEPTRVQEELEVLESAGIIYCYEEDGEQKYRSTCQRLTDNLHEVHSKLVGHTEELQEQLLD